MHICMICPEIGNAKTKAFIGGHTNNVLSLSKSLSEAGHEITIVTTPHRYGDTNVIDSFEWATVRCLDTKGNFISAIQGAEFAAKSIREIKGLSVAEDIDVIHGHSGFTMPALITSIAGSISQVPCVQSIYSPIYSNNAGVLKSLSNNTLSRHYFFGIKKTVASSTAVKNSLIDAGLQKSSIEVIPPIIKSSFNINVGNPEIRDELRIEKDAPVISYMGNLSNNKGLDLALDCLAGIKERYPDVILLMILNMPIETYNSETRQDADMDLLRTIKARIREHKLEKNVRPIGLTERMPEILAASDVFIMPFRTLEGVADPPLSLLEAMAVGKPVVATSVGSIPEWLEDGVNGLLIEPHNCGQLERSIVRLIDNPKEAEKMGMTSASIINGSFRADKVTSRLEKIYHQVIGD